MEKNEHFLKAQGIVKTFGGVTALKNVDMEISPGEILCLIGENGSGKSTLIKVISGVHQPDAGHILIEGQECRALSPIDSIKAGIQVIYQDFSLFPNLTVAENIALSQFLAGGQTLVKKKSIKTIAQAALSEVKIDLDPDLLVEQLSVAQKQLVAIARATWQQAKLIIMDEPTTALTAREVDNLFEVVERLRASGCGILFVSHKLGEVQRIADRVMVLRNGEKVADGPASEFNNDNMAYYISGKQVEKKQYRLARDPSDEMPVLQARQLGLAGHFADVDFSLYKGEILGITGLLGSGRTELALALFGVMPSDTGSLYLDGKERRIASVQDAIKASIGYVPEDRLTEGLFLEESIRNNILVRIIREGRHFFLNQGQLGRQAQQQSDELQIKTNSIANPAGSLSGGNQQRVVLAKWLSILPKILIMNGPTVGVDIGSKAEIHQIIHDLARQGISVIIISDDIPELMQTCNRILVMKEGRFTDSFATEELDEQVLYNCLK